MVTEFVSLNHEKVPSEIPKKDPKKPEPIKDPIIDPNECDEV